MAQRKTKSEWLALFEEQKQSGLSIAKFCKNKLRINLKEIG